MIYCFTIEIGLLSIDDDRGEIKLTRAFPQHFNVIPIHFMQTLYLLDLIYR